MRFAGFICAFLLVCGSTSALANEAVKQFADNLAKQALAIAADKALSKPQKQAKLETLFSTHVDIDWVAQFVAGKHWRTATEPQKQSYLANYRKFLLKNYAARLTDYSGESYKITGVQEEGAGEYTLDMVLKVPNQPDIPVDYRIRAKGKGFAVYDIIVEGISMITTQRSEFNSVISSKGFDYLIGALAKKANKAA